MGAWVVIGWVINLIIFFVGNSLAKKYEEKQYWKACSKAESARAGSLWLLFFLIPATILAFFEVDEIRNIIISIAMVVVHIMQCVAICQFVGFDEAVFDDEQQKIKNRQYQKEQDEKKKQEKIEQKRKEAIDIYEKCASYGIKDVSTESDKKNLSIIASNLNITIEQVAEQFCKGKEYKEEDTLNERYEKYRSEYERINEDAQVLVGKSKYTFASEYYISDYEKNIEKMSDLIKEYNKMILEVYGLNANQSVAQSYINRYERDRDDCMNELAKLKSLQKEWIDIVESVQACMIDSDDVNEKFNKLQIGDVIIVDAAHEYVKVSFEVKTSIEQFKILSKDAILDGILRITVKDDNGKIIGLGHFMPNVGFAKTKKAKAIVKMDCEYNSQLTYNFTITADSMWLIESTVLDYAEKIYKSEIDV